MLDVAYPSGSGGSGGSGAVSSVNGKVGDVILTADDVGALPKADAIKADSRILPNEMVKYDPLTKTLLPAGIHVDNDDVNFFDAGILLGGVRIHSQGSNLVMQNELSKDFSLPIFQPVEHVLGRVKDPQMRAFISVYTETGANDVANVVNPRWTLNKNYEGLYVRLTLNSVTASPDVILRISYATTQFRIKLGAITIGQNVISLPQPLDLPKNTNITLSLEARDGSDVTFRGEGTTPWFRAFGSKYEWTELATRVETLRFITEAPNDGKSYARKNKNWAEVSTTSGGLPGFDLANNVDPTADTSLEGMYFVNEYGFQNPPSEIPNRGYQGLLQKIDGWGSSGNGTRIEYYTSEDLWLKIKINNAWSGWIKISKGTEVTSADLPTSVDPTSPNVSEGRYIVNANGFQNAPSSITSGAYNGTLQKLVDWGASKNGIRLIYYTATDLWVRTKLTSIWSGWVKIGGGGVPATGNIPTAGTNPQQTTLKAGVYIVAPGGFWGAPTDILDGQFAGILRKTTNWGSSKTGQLIEYYTPDALYTKNSLSNNYWTNWIKVGPTSVMTADLPASGINPQQEILKEGLYAVNSAGFWGDPTDIEANKFEGILRKTTGLGTNGEGQLIEYYSPKAFYTKNSLSNNYWTNWVKVGPIDLPVANGDLTPSGPNPTSTSIADGKYYVSASGFPGPPANLNGTDLGVLEKVTNIGTSGIFGILKYHCLGGYFYKLKTFGGWESNWRNATGAIQLAVPSGGGHSAPHASSWNSANAEVTSGWADMIGQPISTVDHTPNGGHMIMTKTSNNPQYAYLLMSPEDASHVTGIKIDGGLASEWASHSVTINNLQYTVFESPYKFTDTTIRIDVEWDS